MIIRIFRIAKREYTPSRIKQFIFLIQVHIVNLKIMIWLSPCITTFSQHIFRNIRAPKTIQKHLISPINIFENIISIIIIIINRIIIYVTYQLFQITRNSILRVNIE